jgi:hypothetical protein
MVAVGEKTVRDGLLKADSAQILELITLTRVWSCVREPACIAPFAESLRIIEAHLGLVVRSVWFGLAMEELAFVARETSVRLIVVAADASRLRGHWSGHGIWVWGKGNEH